MNVASVFGTSTNDEPAADVWKFLFTNEKGVIVLSVPEWGVPISELA